MSDTIVGKLLKASFLSEFFKITTGIFLNWCLRSEVQPVHFLTCAGKRSFCTASTCLAVLEDPERRHLHRRMTFMAAMKAMTRLVKCTSVCSDCVEKWDHFL